MKFTERDKNRIIIVFFLTLIMFTLDLVFGAIIIGWFKQLYAVNGGNSIFLPFFVNIIPGAVGIFLGLYVDSWRLRNKFNVRVEKILPLIIFELYKNKNLINKRPPIDIKKEYFRTEYWRIYQNELSQWAFANIVTLTEIYGLMEHYDPSNRIITLESITKTIEYLLLKYRKGYSKKSNKNARKRFDEALKQFREIEISSTHLLLIMEIRKDFSIVDST